MWRRASFSILCLSCSLVLTGTPGAADELAPSLRGPYVTGYQVIDAVDTSRNDRSLPTGVWYPVDPEDASGEPLQYLQPYPGGLWPYESPFLGGVMDAPVSAAGPFPLVVLSHGFRGPPESFEMLAESLSSHGFMVAAPRHTGDAWGTPLNLAGVNSHRPRDIQFIIDLMVEKNELSGDPLYHRIDTSAIGAGGHSFGAYTTTSAVSGHSARRDDEFDVLPDDRIRALMLLDGGTDLIMLRAEDQIRYPVKLTLEERLAVDVPVLSVAGGGVSFAINSYQLPAAPTMFGVDLADTNHWSFVTNNCQYRQKLVEAEAPDEVIQFIGPDWPGCDSNLRPLSDVQEAVAQRAIAFFKHTLSGDTSTESFLRPDSENDNPAVLSARLLGTDLGSIDFMLTDPSGRRLGVETTFGKDLNEIGDGATFRLDTHSQTFVIPAQEVLPGEYTLAARGGETLTTSQRLQVTRTLAEPKAEDIVFARDVLHLGTVQPGVPIATVDFVLSRTQNPAPLLRPGDADQDLDFDQLDLVKVIRGGKYQTGSPATWGEGDWNGGPGGSPGNPPAGDGVFNVLDLIAALKEGIFLTGAYSAAHPDNAENEGPASIGYDGQTGEFWLDIPHTAEIQSIRLHSTSGIFTQAATPEVAGVSVDQTPHTVFLSTFPTDSASMSLGKVASPGLEREFLLNDLNVEAIRLGRGSAIRFNLAYIPVPEPSGVVVLLSGLVAVLGLRLPWSLRGASIYFR